MVDAFWELISQLSFSETFPLFLSGSTLSWRSRSNSQSSDCLSSSCFSRSSCSLDLDSCSSARSRLSRASCDSSCGGIRDRNRHPSATPSPNIKIQIRRKKKKSPGPCAFPLASAPPKVEPFRCPVADAPGRPGRCPICSGDDVHTHTHKKENTVSHPVGTDVERSPLPFEKKRNGTSVN